MLIPGTYTTRNGRIAKVYEIITDEYRECAVAVGAMFTAGGIFLGAETWRADDGQFFISGKPCGMDIALTAAVAA